MLNVAQAHAQDTTQLKFNFLAIHSPSIPSTNEPLLYIDGQLSNNQQLAAIKPDNIYSMTVVNELVNKELADKLTVDNGRFNGALLVTTKQGRNKPAVLAFNEQVIRLTNRLIFSAKHWKLVDQTLPAARYYLDNKPVTRQQAKQAIKASSLLTLLKGPEAAQYAHDPAAATTGVVQLTTTIPSR